MFKTEGANQHCADRPLKSGKRLDTDQIHKVYHKIMCFSRDQPQYIQIQALDGDRNERSAPGDCCLLLPGHISSGGAGRGKNDETHKRWHGSGRHSWRDERDSVHGVSLCSNTHQSAYKQW